jgi:hypothetical protein
MGKIVEEIDVGSSTFQIVETEEGLRFAQLVTVECINDNLPEEVRKYLEGKELFTNEEE